MNSAQNIISNNGGIGQNATLNNSQAGASGSINPIAFMVFWVILCLRRQSLKPALLKP